MKVRVLLAVFVALAMVGCGSEAGDATDDESAAMPQPDSPGWESKESVVISPRTYTGGTVTAKVSGFFEVNGSQTLNVPASLTDEDQTWLQYGVSGSPELDVLFTNSQSMAEHGVTVGMGPWSVTTTSTSGECKTEIDVTPTLVKGRYSCTGSTGYNSQTQQMGEVDVEVEFSAGS
jgi:Flp pilus assembly pilin Flp